MASSSKSDDLDSQGSSSPDPLVHRKLTRRQKTLLAQKRNAKSEKHLKAKGGDHKLDPLQEPGNGEESLTVIRKQFTRKPEAFARGETKAGSNNKTSGKTPPSEFPKTNLPSTNKYQSQGSFIAPSHLNIDTSKFESEAIPQQDEPAQKEFQPPEIPAERRKSVNRNAGQSVSWLDGKNRDTNVFEEIRKQQTKQAQCLNIFDQSNLGMSKQTHSQERRRASERSTFSPAGSINAMFYNQPVEEGSMRSFVAELDQHKAKIAEEDEVQQQVALTQQLVNQYILEKMTKIKKKREEITQAEIDQSMESTGEDKDEDTPSQADPEASQGMSAIMEEESSKPSVQDYFIRRDSPVSPKLAPQTTYLFPPGYAAQNDPDQQKMEEEKKQQALVEKEKKRVLKLLTARIKAEYQKKFESQVDLHHRLAYAFERAYKMGRRYPEKKETLDMEIICILSEHSDYIFSDPMVMFYSVFFCVFYNNSFLLNFLKSLLDRIRIPSSTARQKIINFLELIDEYGIERIRTIGESVNTRAYHIVLFAAFDEKLKVIYTKVISRLLAVFIRDKDARLLLQTNDHEQIKIVLDKKPAKLSPRDFGPTIVPPKSVAFHYSHYSAAFFEEILLEFDSDTQWRVAKYFRERFLITEEAMAQVLEMYAQKDHMDHFLLRDHEQLGYARFVHLFNQCIKHNSFKLGLQIYLRFLRGSDIQLKTMNLLIDSIRDSEKYLELKLFLLLEHFQTMDVEAIGRLIDVLLRVTQTKKYELSPILNSFNTMKVSVLMYRVTWLIEGMNLFSLVTKCRILRKFIEDAIDSYLSFQTNIEQLYRFMLEPVLSIRHEQDTLDLMMEMDMQHSLNHNVITEVLNLVYESLYSIDSSPLFLSKTFESLLYMPALAPKRIWTKLSNNLKAMDRGRSDGGDETKQQTALQFHIWKNCIRQRLLDETIFIFLFCLIFLYYALLFQYYTSKYISMEKDIFGASYLTDQEGFVNLPIPLLQKFCPEGTQILVDFGLSQDHYSFVAYYTSVSMLLSIFQKTALKWRKPDIFLDYTVLLSESLIVAAGVILLKKQIQNTEEHLIHEACGKVMTFEEEYEHNMEHGYYFITDFGKADSYQVSISLNIFLFGLYFLILLKRTESLGPMLMLIEQMLIETAKFVATLGLVIGGFYFILRFSHYYIKHKSEPIFETFLTMINSILGKTTVAEFRHPFGGVFVVSMSFILKAFLLSILATMIVVRWMQAWKTVEATKRKDIITVKGTHCYDPLYGAITMTFFPMNIFLIVFLLPILFFRSERLNLSTLQIQYYLMIMFYVIILLPFAAIAFPFLYLKLILNQAYLLSIATTRSQKLHLTLDLIGTIILGPFMVLASFGADLIQLNQTLMRPEKEFVFKYLHSNLMNEINPEVIMKSFYTTFIIDFDRRWRGYQKTEHETMIQHRASFRIVDMFHSVFCRGDRTYKDSVYNIKLFNFSKILSSQCSIPSQFGEKRLDLLNYNLIHNILEDILLFNYSQFCVDHYKLGVNLKSIQDEIVKYGYPHRDYDLEKHEFCSSLTRDASDLFNFFSISIVAKAFTDILEVAKSYQIETNFWYTRRQALLINRLKMDWVEELARNGADDLLGKIVKSIEEKVDRPKLVYQKTKTFRGIEKLKTQMMKAI